MQTITQGASKTVTISSTAFQQGQPIPAAYTCKGRDVSPPLSWSGVPNAAKALALVMDDPDAPAGTWTHWTFWNLPPSATSLPEDASVAQLAAREGKTSSGGAEYHGPCPPSGTHRYFFKLYALSAPLDLPAGASVEQLNKALSGKVLAWGELMGTFSRP